MKLYKFYFVLNVALLIMETITIYIYNGEKLWLIIMLLAIVIQIMTIISANEEKKE